MWKNNEKPLFCQMLFWIVNNSFFFQYLRGRLTIRREKKTKVYLNNGYNAKVKLWKNIKTSFFIFILLPLQLICLFWYLTTDVSVWTLKLNAEQYWKSSKKKKQFKVVYSSLDFASAEHVTLNTIARKIFFVPVYKKDLPHSPVVLITVCRYGMTNCSTKSILKNFILYKTINCHSFNWFLKSIFFFSFFFSSFLLSYLQR